jgi:hypothetical protein
MDIVHNTDQSFIRKLGNRNNLGDLRLNRNEALNRQCVRAWMGFSRLMLGLVKRSCEQNNKPSCSLKCGNAKVRETLSTELVS